MKRPRDHTNTSNNSVSYRSDLNRADVQPHAAIAAFYAEVRSPSLLPRQAMCLYNAVRSGGCMRGLCVGSVDGAAALYVGAALAENVVGKEAGAVLVSQVDPRLLADGGAARLAACGFSGITARVDAAQPDVAALPMLLEKGERFDFAHLDGIHLFDHAMVSFFFLDLLLDVGGCLILEGCGLGAVESGPLACEGRSPLRRLCRSRLYPRLYRRRRCHRHRRCRRRDCQKRGAGQRE